MIHLTNSANAANRKDRVTGKLTGLNLIVGLVLMTTLYSFGQSSHVTVVVNTTDVNFNYGGKNAELKHLLIEFTDDSAA